MRPELSTLNRMALVNENKGQGMVVEKLLNPQPSDLNPQASNLKLGP
jgi:hypothetical protein